MIQLNKKKESEFSNLKKLVALILILISVLMMSSCTLALIGSLVDESSEDENSVAVSEIKTESEDVKKSDVVYRVGETYTSKKESITFVDCYEYQSDNMFLQPKDENYRFICLKFEYTNLDKYDAFISSSDFNCYADGVACDGQYLFDDTLSATVSTGRKAVGFVYFEAPRLANVIEVEYGVDLLYNLTPKKVIFLYEDTRTDE